MSRRGFATIEIYIPIVVLAIFMAILVPNFLVARAQGQLRACCNNVKNLSTALEMYATDFDKQYPKQLRELTPDYLKVLPTCPAATRDTYSNSYSVSESEFSLCCQGENHLVDRLNYPSFSSRSGLSADAKGKLLSQSNTGLLTMIGSGLILWGCFIKLWFRPQPMPVVEQWEKENTTMEAAGCLGWWLLNLLLGGLGIHWLGFQLGLPLGVVAADLLTRAGWMLWQFLSPSHQAEVPQENPTLSRIPGLSQPLKVPIQLEPREKSLQRLASLSFPTLFAVLTLTLSLDPDPLRSRLFGLALTALLGFPLYLWGRWLAQRLLERQLELLPGSGQLVLHGHRWGRPTLRAVGNLAQANHLGKGQVRVGRQVFWIDNQVFLSYLPQGNPVDP